jgi:hypothetical protein
VKYPSELFYPRFSLETARAIPLWANTPHNGSAVGIGQIENVRDHRQPRNLGVACSISSFMKKRYRIGGTLNLDDLDATDIGDWKMSDYKAACAYAVSQGWLVIENDTLMLTTAGLAAA